MFRFLLVVSCFRITRGIEIYNYKENICCNGKVHKMPDYINVTQVFNRDFDGIENIFLSEQFCCGEHLYNEEISFCYNGRIFQLSPDSQNNVSCGILPHLLKSENWNHYWKQSRCCEETGTLYDFKSQICCNHSITYREVSFVSKDFFQKTDQNITYYKRNQECCSGKIIDIDKEICCRHTSQEYILTTATYHSQTNQRCCGSSTYLTWNATCCDDHLIPGRFNYTACCGNELINTKTQLCVKGKPIWKRSKNEYSCGNSVMNLETHVCINGTIVAKGENEKWWENLQSCGHSYYDAYKQICCSGEVFNVPYEKEAFDFRCCEKLDEARYFQDLLDRYYD